MNIDDFDYELPKDLIAHTPALSRTKSRLLVVDDEKVSHKSFSDVINYFQKGDVLVVNESKVLKAQLDAKKPTGGKLKVMISEKKGTEGNLFRCKIKGGGVREGTILSFRNVQAKVISVDVTDFIVDFGDFDVPLLMEKQGREPLPPYIKGNPDLTRYQTVYANTLGSLAAPTAGLHFSDELLQEITAKGVIIAKITLHVSFGTFSRVRVDDITKHKMEPEYYTITKKSADKINNRAGRLIVVGTTSLKTIESSANDNGKVLPGSAWSELFIYPGYKFKTNPDALITNFHLPKSTLMMMVSAYYGREKIMKIYAEAVKENYRFFSFGDAMLLLRSRSE